MRVYRQEMKDRKFLVEREIQKSGNDIQELKRFLETNKKDIENQILELKGRNELNETNIKQVEKELEKEKQGQNKRIRAIIEEIQEMKLKIQKSEEYFMENRFVNSKAENVKCGQKGPINGRPVDPRKMLQKTTSQANVEHRKRHFRKPGQPTSNRPRGQTTTTGQTQVRSHRESKHAQVGSRID